MEKSIYAMRSSVRSFKGDEVSKELVETLLQAAVEAPSAGNCQPWHFYVVRRENLIKGLCKSAYNQRFIETAPVVIVVCAEPQESAGRYFGRGESLYCIQDTAAAIENILLSAAENRLGACWCGAFDEDAARAVLHLPETRRPVAIIPIGYPGAAPDKKPARRPMAETVTYLE